MTNIVVVFVIHWHESDMGVYVSPHPEPPFYLPPHSCSMNLEKVYLDNKNNNDDWLIKLKTAYMKLSNEIFFHIAEEVWYIFYL